MPIFEYECPNCGTSIDVLIIENSNKNPKILPCKNCGCYIDLINSKPLPGAPSFKIKGLRAANGYGLKFQDTYGVSKTDGHESGYSFTSNKAETSDHNQGQERKA